MKTMPANITARHDDARVLFENDIHPRLFFGPADISALQEKARSGFPARALREILRRCEGYLAPASPIYVDTDGGPAALFAGVAPEALHAAGDVLHTLAFAHILTADTRWADKAVAMLRIMLAVDGRSDLLEQAAQSGQLAVAYDLLDAVLDDATRRTLRTYLRITAVEGYRKRRLGSMGAYIWGLGTNRFLHGFEKYLFALAAVFDPVTDWPLLDEAADLARRSLHLGFDDGGAIYEGPSYGWGDAEWLSMPAEILRRAGVADLWREEPRFANICRHWAYLVLPGRRGQNTIGDAWRFAAQRRPHWASLLHARRLDDPVLQWVWESLGGRGEVPGRGDSPETFGGTLGYAVLWEGNAATATDPGQAGWPAARCSGDAGIIVMRSGWRDEDLYFSILSAGRTSGSTIHQHVDAGHFCLFAMNEAFSIDSGYGDIKGCYHSVMMPAGREPPGTPEDFGSMFFGGSVAAFETGKQIDYARVDIGTQWNCHWYYRHALLIRGPGAAPYVVLLDDANYRSDMLSYEWLLNSEPGNRIELDPETQRAVIHGREHRLELAWSHPAPGDYPVPHRLEIGWDAINSFPLSHRIGDVNYFHATDGTPRPLGGGRWGAGIRPRIKATLWGYNGQLLTALVPRRRGEAPVMTERLGAMGHFGIRIHLDGVTDTIVASPIDRHLDLDGITGEAQLAFIRRDPAGKILCWGAMDAYALTLNGLTVLGRQQHALNMVEG